MRLWPVRLIRMGSDEFWQVAPAYCKCGLGSSEPGAETTGEPW
jgi:hypothetical protein